VAAAVTTAEFILNKIQAFEQEQSRMQALAMLFATADLQDGERCAYSS
jgi:hypothetical protein